MSNFVIAPYTEDFREHVIQLALRAWDPVFAKTRTEVPSFVYEAFYPEGWDARQASDVAAMLDDGETSCWLALEDGSLVGFVGVRIHPKDKMGEIYILAIDPDHQGKGIGQMLMLFAEEHIRDAGMSMVMVETVGDSGHAPARRLYEASGYEPWPVARYFKRL